MVLAKSLALTFVLCVAIGLATAEGLSRLWAHYAGGGLDDGYYVVLQGLATAVIVLFAFRAIAVPVIGLFADDVVAAIEARHYPAAAQIARPAGITTSLRLGASSLLRLIGFNLLALPLYVILIFTAIGPLILFVIVNALLLGRDLGEMVAIRHMDRRVLADWLGNTRGSRALLGLVVTGIFLVPGVNLIGPVIGAGLATHMFHRSRV